MEKKLAAAMVTVQEVESKMKSMKMQHELDMRETMDTCKVLRAENDRLRARCQSVMDTAHKTNFHLHRELNAGKKALAESQHLAGLRLGKSAAQLAESRKATQRVQQERDQVVQAYYSTSEELIEVANGLEVTEMENDQLRREYESMEETFWEQTKSAQARVAALAKEKQTFQSEMVKARAALEEKFMAQSALQRQDVLDARSEKVRTSALLQVSADEVATVKVELGEALSQTDLLERRNAELQDKVHHLKMSKEQEQAKCQAAERDIAVLRTKLNKSQEEVGMLQQRQEETELMLRDRVDWQKYAPPAFLAPGVRSRAHMQTYSPYATVSAGNAPDEGNPTVPATVLDATRRFDSLAPHALRSQLVHVL